MVPIRLRIRFTKEGDLRLISHRDLVRTWERLFRRADVPLAMSEGYHPKPRMTFPSALALGIAGQDEVLEVQLADEMEVGRLQNRLADHAPEGLRIKEVQLLPAGTPKARVRSVVYQVQVPCERKAQVEAAVAHLRSQQECLVHREGRKKALDLMAEMEELHFDGEILSMRLRVGQEGAIKPREVLAALDAADLELGGHPLARSHVEIA